MNLTLTEIQRLDLKPGQILVVKIPPQECTAARRAIIMAHLSKLLPKGTRVLVCPDTTRFEAINPPEDETVTG